MRIISTLIAFCYLLPFSTCIASESKNEKEVSEHAEEKVAIKEQCQEEAALTMGLATLRQKGLSFEAQLDSIEKNTKNDADTKALLREIIGELYRDSSIQGRTYVWYRFESCQSQDAETEERILFAAAAADLRTCQVIDGSEFAAHHECVKDVLAAHGQNRIDRSVDAEPAPP